MKVFLADGSPIEVLHGKISHHPAGDSRRGWFETRLPIADEGEPMPLLVVDEDNQLSLGVRITRRFPLIPSWSDPNRLVDAWWFTPPEDWTADRFGGVAAHYDFVACTPAMPLRSG